MIHKGRLKFLFQTASFYFPNLKRNNAVGVGRILESDACSQNKFSGAEKMSDTSIRPTTLKHFFRRPYFVFQTQSETTQ